MSEFTVCRTLDTHPALRYCLLLDDDRIAGGKPDYRGDNILISWRTNETYGPVDALLIENAKLRELLADMWRLIEDLDATPYVTERQGNNPAVTWLDEDLSVHESCKKRIRELGVEVDG